MADLAPQSPQIAQQDEAAEQKRLRYLEFVHAAAVQAVMWAAALYGRAKESAGPLRPVVHSMEGAVMALVGPVYDKYHGVPFELLKFVDQKVGELDGRVPPTVKEAAAAAHSAACEVRQAGLARTLYRRCEPAARDLYAKYEPAAEQAAASAWLSLSRLPLVAHLARIALPTVVHLSEKYNQAVRCSAQKGYAFSAHLPLLPTERIARLLAGEATAKAS